LAASRPKPHVAKYRGVYDNAIGCSQRPRAWPPRIPPTDRDDDPRAAQRCGNHRTLNEPLRRDEPPKEQPHHEDGCDVEEDLIAAGEELMLAPLRELIGQVYGSVTTTTLGAVHRERGQTPLTGAVARLEHSRHDSRPRNRLIWRFEVQMHDLRGWDRGQTPPRAALRDRHAFDAARDTTGSDPERGLTPHTLTIEGSRRDHATADLACC
jgi:hypothetical protein